MLTIFCEIFGYDFVLGKRKVYVFRYSLIHIYQFPTKITMGFDSLFIENMSAWSEWFINKLNGPNYTRQIRNEQTPFECNKASIEE